jgi:putative membrane protein
MDWDGGWWILMVLGMLIFWAFVLVGLIWLFRERSGTNRRWRDAAGADDPLAILDRRLAQGEITAEDYRERRAILNGSSNP